MKRLITIILILALLLPAAALADNYIDRHYAMHVKFANTFPGQGPALADSVTIDLYLSSDGETAYCLKTQCVSGLFLCDGMTKMSIQRYDDDDVFYCVDAVGHYLQLKEEDDKLFIFFRDEFREMQLIDAIYIYQ